MRNRLLIPAIVVGFFLTLIVVSNARADVYVKVDANGNATGGAIMCDASTCGAGSEYSRLTLQAGEQYVLQGTGHAGIGNNNPNTQVKVDLQTNDWTVTRQSEPTIVAKQTVEATTIQKFNPIQNTSTTTTEIKVLEAQPIAKTEDVLTNSDPVMSDEDLTNIELLDINSPNWWKVFITWLNKYYVFDWWFTP